MIRALKFALLMIRVFKLYVSLLMIRVLKNIRYYFVFSKYTLLYLLVFQNIDHVTYNRNRIVIDRQRSKSRESGRQAVRRLWWMVFGVEMGRLGMAKGTNQDRIC